MGNGQGAKKQNSDGNNKEEDSGESPNKAPVKKEVKEEMKKEVKKGEKKEIKKQEIKKSTNTQKSIKAGIPTGQNNPLVQFAPADSQQPKLDPEASQSIAKSDKQVRVYLNQQRVRLIHLLKLKRVKAQNKV